MNVILPFFLKMLKESFKKMNEIIIFNKTIYFLKDYITVFRIL